MRRALRSLVCTWLLLQLTGFVVAPVAVCHGADALAAGSHAGGHQECNCDEAVPGQACPMHKPSAGDDHCVIEADCTSSPSVLITLLGGIGLLPPTAASAGTLIAGDLTPAGPSLSIARAELPDPPPPRA